jgi:NhaP-type Na+/H+ or K+/H+ antiporter
MTANLLLGLALILFLGILAQWISWRFRLPSILLLLLFGFFAGPLTNYIDPDLYFGNLLFPIVSIFVAVILFEGGLSLKLSELRTAGTIIRNLISIGIAVTWILSSLFSYYILNLDFPLAVLLGAILVVTGPTVILPILRHVRPTGQVNSILKWEGIINDPIGALLAILVFEGIVAAGFTEATAQVVFSLLKTVLLGSLIGFIGAYVIVFLLRYHLIPDFLQNSVSLAMVVSVFSISNLFQSESGLLTVTVMGVFLANQKIAAVRNIIEFKENLRVLLLSILFILLSARLKISDLTILGFESYLFIALLIFIVRPASVFFSTFKSSLNWKEKLYISSMAPRGVVAAAVTSVFAIELTKQNYANADYLVPLMFMVIIITITIYGFIAMPLAQRLGLANSNPQGCLILGAHAFGRAIGKVLKNHGLKVLLVDTNYANISLANSEGLSTYHGSIISEDIIDEIDISGLGRLLAMTPNEEVNSLAALYFSKIFGSRDVYQLSVEADKARQGKNVSKELRGKILFGTAHTYLNLSRLFNERSLLKTTTITDKFDFESFKREETINLCLIDKNKNLFIYTDLDQPKPKPGNVLVSL